MRILFVTAHKYLPQMHGGLQSSTHELCRALLKRGHHVSVLAGIMPGGCFALMTRIKMQMNKKLRGEKLSLYQKLGYPVWLTWHPWELVEKVAAKERPDLIVVTSYYAVPMALAAKNLNCPVLMQLHDVEFTLHGGPFEDLQKNITFVANSHFTSEKYQTEYGINSSVIWPFINTENYKVNSTRENVTFINPSPQKGCDRAIEIARQCPDIPFVFVESWPLSPQDWQELNAKIKNIPNIKVLPVQKDMRAVYAKSRILLAPSVWEEAFGRVAFEAEISGIPVVASRRGGLPEAVGQGGILLNPDQPTEDWVTAIRKLWQDQDYYRNVSKDALTHTKNSDVATQTDKWELAFTKAIENPA